ncbi:MAG: hypothetical protein APF76_08380 [Desulfitibacter sp. BRH_c19]|nr:MAG: hypothetical protein APF76_08380 [Desulfitibacter sp. BRH_c19]
MKFKIVELEEAQDILLNNINPLQGETILIENLNGRVLAEDIYSPINVPSFKKSPLDGFALRAEDSKGACKDKPVKITIVDEVQAGDTRQISRIEGGCGVKILTGAPIPDGLDVVIKKEDVLYEEEQISLTEELPSDSNVIFIGSDMKEGELLLSKGELLGPYYVGILAAVGLTQIKTYKNPQVAVLSTGSELKLPGEELEHGQIYNSNLPSLIALINSLGGKGRSLGCISDDTTAIAEKILVALQDNDLIVTTGGASVGDYDLIEAAFRYIGAEILFNRVNIKPGTPVIGAVKDGKLMIGLSGNPAAALISFELLVRPLIKKFQGFKNIKQPILEVILEEGFSKKSPQRRYLRVHVSYENGKWVAKQTGKQASSIMKSMAGCNALIDIPAGTGPIPPGVIVKAVLLKEEI